MKKLLLSLLSVGLLSASDVSSSIDDVAQTPEFSGSCDKVVQWALTEKPTVTLNDYFVGDAVSFSQDLKVSRRVGKGGFDGDNSIKSLTTQINCFKSDDVQKKIDESVEYYRRSIEDKTNPLINQIKNTATLESGKTSKSKQLVNDFTFQTDSKASDGFFGGFLEEIKSPYEAAQSYIVLFFILTSLVALGGEWIFYNFGKLVKSTSAGKASSIEVLHRFAVALPILFFFYAGGPTTRVQNMFAGLVAEGTNLADALVTGVQVANAKHSIREISSKTGPTTKQLETKVRETVLANEQASINAGILQSCTETWRVDELKKYSKSSDLMFSATPQKLQKSVSEFEMQFIKNKMPYTEEEYDKKPPQSWFTIETCGEAEKAYRTYLKAAPKRQKYFESVLDFNPQKVKFVVESSMSKNITLGWTSIALLPAQQAMQSQKNTIDAQMDKSAWDKANYKGVDYDFTNAPADVDTIKALATETGNFSISQTIESMTQRAAFLFVPGATGIYTTFKGLMEGVTNIATSSIQIAASTTEAMASGDGWLSKIPGVAEIVRGGSKMILKVIDLGRSAIYNIVPFYIATEAAKIMIESLVYIIPLLVSGVVIAWWYVEVFGYMIMIPFAAGYAFGENAKANIINFIVKGFGLAFKPMLIVLGVFLAVKAAAILEQITGGMISAQEMMMVSQANTVLDNTHWNLSNPLDGWGSWLASTMRAGLIQGVLFIALAIIKVVLMSSVIMKFPGFILGLMNINADTNAGESVASKISIMTKGI